MVIRNTKYNNIIVVKQNNNIGYVYIKDNELRSTNGIVINKEIEEYMKNR